MEIINYPRLIDSITERTGANRGDVRSFLQGSEHYTAWHAGYKSGFKGMTKIDPPCELVRSLASRFTGKGTAAAGLSDVSGVPPDVAALIKDIEASKASGGAAPPDPPVLNREYLRRVMGKGGSAREQARGNTSASGTVPGGEPDYFQLVAAVRAQRGCGFVDAARVVNREHPKSWAAMLSKANGGRDFSDRIANR